MMVTVTMIMIINKNSGIRDWGQMPEVSRNYDDDNDAIIVVCLMRRNTKL